MDGSNFQRQPVNDSDIFNDGFGGIDPSINESIRQSIDCSFVSADMSGSIDAGRIEDKTRDQGVMNRMNWITYLKVLFD
jgi:hypothetical protein